MSDTRISSVAEFIRSLNDAQRKYFLLREAVHRSVLQETVGELSKGLGNVSELHNETVLVALHQAASRQG